MLHSPIPPIVGRSFMEAPLIYQAMISAVFYEQSTSSFRFPQHPAQNTCSRETNLDIFVMTLEYRHKVATMIFQKFCVLLPVVVLLAGCGKSEEDKKMESDLNTQILHLHDYYMASINRMGQLQSQIDSALARHDSLARLRPGFTASESTDDLTSVKARIDSARSAMNAWMQAYTPYEPSMSHEVAMTKLKGDKDDLTEQTSNALGIIDAAGTAIDRHRKLQDSLSATPEGGLKRRMR